MSLLSELKSIREAHEARLASLDQDLPATNPLKDVFRRASYDLCILKSAEAFQRSFATLPVPATLSEAVQNLNAHYPKIVASFRKVFPEAYDPELVREAATCLGTEYISVAQRF